MSTEAIEDWLDGVTFYSSLLSLFPFFVVVFIQYFALKGRLTLKIVEPSVLLFSLLGFCFLNFRSINEARTLSRERQEALFTIYLLIFIILFLSFGLTILYQGQLEDKLVKLTERVLDYREKEEIREFLNSTDDLKPIYEQKTYFINFFRIFGLALLVVVVALRWIQKRKFKIE